MNRPTTHIVALLIFSLTAFAQQEGQWQSMGPFGGVSRFLTRASSGQLYTSFENTGLFRSDNDGESWRAIMEGINGTEVLSFCSAEDGTIYCGSYDAIYQSTDMGNVWHRVADLTTRGDCDAFAIAVTRAGNLFFSSNLQRSLFRSTDHGISWTTIGGIPKPGFGTTLVAAPDSSLIVGTFGHGVYCVRKDSAAAIAISYNIPLAYSGANTYFSTAGLGICDDGSIVLPYGFRLYRLAPDSTQWLRIRRTFDGERIFGGEDSTIYATCWDGVFMSTNRGESWKFMTDSLVRVPVNWFVTTDSGPFLASQFRGGLIRSVDSMRTWAPANNGIVRSDINCVYVTPQQTLLAGTAFGGVFRTSDGGSSWSAPPLPMQGGGSNYIVEVCGDAQGWIYAAEMTGMLWRSVSDGYQWEQAALADYFRAHGIDFRVTGLATTPDNRLRVSGFMWFRDSVGGVYESSDRGITWNRVIAAPLESGAQTFLTLDDSCVIAGTREKGFFRSTDSGLSWIGVGGTTASVVSLVADTGQILLAGSMGAGVLRSLDGGLTWEESNSGLPDLTVRTVKRFGVGFLFAGTDVGGFVSSDHGEEWSATGPAGCGSVKALYQAANGEVYLVTSTGVFRGTAPVSVDQWKSSQTASSFALDQNFPNPFNPATTITYRVGSRTRILLGIYNMLGQKIATLVEREEEAGEHSVRFEGRNLASGVYFCRLQAGEFVQARSLLILR